MLDTAESTPTRTFVDDPMFEWVFPDPGTRTQKLAVLNRIPLYDGLRRLRVTRSDGGRGGRSGCGRGSPSPRRGWRAGLLAAPCKVGFVSLGRFARANATMEPLDKQTMGGQPHWQLLIVVVDRNLQGQGNGAALVRDGLDQADLDGLPCYLDTRKAANSPFYKCR